MFLITSKFKHYVKDENGVRIPCVIPDENGILTLIDKNITGYKRLLVIANDPGDFNVNDSFAEILFKAFMMTNRKFVHFDILDNRTLNQTTELIYNADLIYLCGGEILRQLEFLKQINFVKLIENYRGIVITVSAASMCLTKTILNFPEHQANLKEPRIIQGLGLLDINLIPHLDGATLTYQGTSDMPNLVKDYILPLSDEREICALPNGSYIVFDGKNIVGFCGPFDKIYQRKVI